MPPADARPLATAPCVIQAIEIRSTCSDNCLVFMRTRPSPARARERTGTRTSAGAERARTRDGTALSWAGSGRPPGEGVRRQQSERKDAGGDNSRAAPDRTDHAWSRPAVATDCAGGRRARRQRGYPVVAPLIRGQRVRARREAGAGRRPGVQREGGGLSLFLGGTTTASADRSPQ